VLAGSLLAGVRAADIGRVHQLRGSCPRAANLGQKVPAVPLVQDRLDAARLWRDGQQRVDYGPSFVPIADVERNVR